MTVENAFEDFLNSKRAEGIKDKTIKTYMGHFGAVRAFLDTEKDIELVSRRDIDKMLIGLKNKGLSPNSIKSYTATLKSFFSWCREEDLTNLNIKLYKGVETLKDTYTDQELRQLLVKPKGGFCEYRNWVIINMLLNSGCRASTIRHILIKDVNLSAGTISYRHTKNGSIQIIPLCDEMIKILKAYLKRREGSMNDYLFPADNNKQMTENGLSEAIRRYNRDRGVEKTSIHLFRHSFAERYLRAGGNPFDLQRILGHSTLAMTKHYCRIYDNELVKNYNRFSPLENLRR